MRSKFIKMGATALTAVVLMSGVAGCATGTGGNQAASDVYAETHAELVENAQAEGTVTWYTFANETIIDSIAKKFDELYGIKLVGHRAAGGKLITRYESERDAGAPVADVYNVGVAEPFENSPDEFVDLTKMPLESLDGWPSEAMQGDGRAIRSGIGMFVIMYNTDLVSKTEVPKTWPEFFTNDIGEIATPNMGNAPAFVLFLKFLEDTYGEQALKDFASAPKQVFDSFTPALAAVAAGEYPLATGTPGLAQALQASGAPIDWYVPEVTSYTAGSLGVPTNAPHRNAGLLLMDFLMSEEGQTLLSAGGATSYMPSVAAKVGIPLPAGAVGQGAMVSEDERARLIALAGF